MRKKKTWMAALAALFAFILIAPVAEAHVTVWPQESATNAYEKYTVRVPVEKDINTTEVNLEIPEGVDVISVLPMPTWDYEVEKNADERITHVIWKANDGGIGPFEFIEFAFVGVNPDEPGEVSWKALQTYEDGSVVEWVGPPDSAEPASVTTITSESTVASDEGNGTATAAANAEPQGEMVAGTASGGSNWLPTLLASLALLLSVISLLRKRA